MRILFLSLLLGLLSACQPSEPSVAEYLTDIKGHGLKNQYQLRDHLGSVRTPDDFKGKVVVLSFGYTFCPDVCPTTLADLANTMKLLGDKAEQVQVVFVTIDPGRDTPEVLSQYVPSFNPSFLGLSGSAQQTAEVAKNFKVYYARQASENPAVYTVDHTAGSYVVDKQGAVRFFIKYGEKPDHIARDLAALL